MRIADAVLIFYEIDGVLIQGFLQNMVQIYMPILLKMRVNIKRKDRTGFYMDSSKGQIMN